ncbi:MAG: hypothetical protein OEW90_05030 [Betaproteobacteria bacterium]|nr:hypothetical protein [Betaproteobacteria bacterium]MDH4323483.1 hypothetical protein [Betaproteobacteria bacterium]
MAVVPTRVLSFDVNESDASPIQGAVITAQLNVSDIYQEEIVDRVIEQAITDVNGQASLNLFPNVLGTRNTVYVIKIRHPVTNRAIMKSVIRMPDTDVNFADIVGNAMADGDFPLVPGINQVVGPGFLFKKADQNYVARAINGTANQINASGAENESLTLSLPQDIHPGASPTFAALTVVGVLTAASIAIAGLTAGRVPYVGPAGALTDTSKLVWDNTNSRLGIGTSAPTHAVTLVETDPAKSVEYRVDYTPTGTFGMLGQILQDGSIRFILSVGGGKRYDLGAGPTYGGTGVFRIRNTTDAITNLQFDPVTSLTTFGGALLVPDGSASVPSLAFATGTNSGIHGGGANIWFSVAGTDIVRISDSNTGLTIRGDHPFGWTSAAITDPVDLVLRRDAANTLAQRNGTNAQRFNLYATFTDASNYSRFRIQSDASNYILQDEFAGTGTARNIYLGPAGASFLQFRTTNLDRAQFTASGHLIWNTDNTLDIGASGANRPRSIYWGTQALGPNGSFAAPTFAFASQTALGFHRRATGSVYFYDNAGSWEMGWGNRDSTASITMSASNGLTLASTVLLGWTSGLETNAKDTILQRDAANVLALRNAANGQTFRVYKTFTDSSNFERFRIQADATLGFVVGSEFAGTGTPQNITFRAASNISEFNNGGGAQTVRIYNTFTDASNFERGVAAWASNILEIGSEIGGTGTARIVRIKAAGANSVLLNTNGADRWNINSSGHFIAQTDNTLDIGASGANRPRYAWLAGGLNALSIASGAAATAMSLYTGRLGTDAFEQARIGHVSSAVNYVLLTGNTTTNAPTVQAAGSDTNVALAMISKGTGTIRFFTAAGASEQARIAHVASAVNYVQVAGGATGNTVTISAEGSDANVSLTLTPKGTGVLRGTGAAAVVLAGKNAIPISAASMAPRQTNGCAFIVTTTGAANQPDVPYLAFDGAAKEYAGFLMRMPKGWNEGTVTAAFSWRRASGTSAANVVWGIRGVAVSDNETPVATFGSDATVTDAASTTTANMNVSGETSACTIGGTPAEGDLVFFEVFRDGAAGGDTLDAVDAWLTEVTLFLTTDAPNDA